MLINTDSAKMRTEVLTMRDKIIKLIRETWDRLERNRFLAMMDPEVGKEYQEDSFKLLELATMLEEIEEDTEKQVV